MLIGDSALARIFRFVPCYSPEGEGDGEPLSYDAQIQADINAAVTEVESKAAPESGAGDPAAAATEGQADNQPPAEGQRDAQGRLRGPDGKFRAAGEADPASQPGASTPGQAAAPGQAVQPGDGADPNKAASDPAAAAAPPSVANPPTSWTVEAKAQWDALPALVKEAIVKRETEMGAGLAALRDFKDLKPYADQARASGTTLSEALGRYVNIENVMRANPAQGFMEAAKNLGMSKAQAADEFMRLAVHLGAKVPANQNGGQYNGQSDQNDDDPLMEVLRPILQSQLAPVLQQNEALARQLNQFTQANQTALEQTIGETLAAMVQEPEFRYLPDLEQAISSLFETGAVRQTGNHRADIARAYRMAAAGDDRIAPLLSNARAAETEQQKQAREADAAAKAAKASRSITGSAVDSAPQPAGKNRRREGMSHDQDLMADVRAAAGLTH